MSGGFCTVKQKTISRTSVWVVTPTGRLKRPQMRANGRAIASRDCAGVNDEGSAGRQLERQ